MKKYLVPVLSILWILALVSIDRIFFLGTSALFLPVFFATFNIWYFYQIKTKQQKIVYAIFVTILVVISFLSFPKVTINKAETIIQKNEEIKSENTRTIPVTQEGISFFKPTHFYLFENSQGESFVMNPDTGEVTKKEVKGI